MACKFVFKTKCFIRLTPVLKQLHFSTTVVGNKDLEIRLKIIVIFALIYAIKIR
jgi:hypothetical protein